MSINTNHIIMAALWYRAGHYIFILWFLLFSFFLLFSSELTTASVKDHVSLVCHGQRVLKRRGIHPFKRMQTSAVNVLWLTKPFNFSQILYHFLFANCCAILVPGYQPILFLLLAALCKALVFNLLRGRFWGFSRRRGDTLHRWVPGEIWHGGGDRPPCQI